MAKFLKDFIAVVEYLTDADGVEVVYVVVRQPFLFDQVGVATRRIFSVFLGFSRDDNSARQASRSRSSI